MMMLRNRSCYFQGVGGMGAPNLVLWFDGDRSILGQADNTAVDAAQDMGPFRNTMTGVPGSRPTFQDAEFGTHDGMAFSAGAARLRVTRTKLPNGFSAFITFKGDGVTTDTSNTTSGNPPMTIIGDSLTANYVMCFGLNGHNVSYKCQTENGGQQTELVSSGLNLMDGFPSTIAISHDVVSGQADVYADGALVATGTRTYWKDRAGFDTIGQGQADTDGFTGTIAEIFVWNGPLDSKTVSALHARSVQIWGS